MGSLTRVCVHYLDLETFLETSSKPTYGAFMEGASIYNQILPTDGILVMGNEANGISPKLEGLIDKKISIPRFGTIQSTESLNVATATAILLSEFSRRTIET
jgi:TrmH family RNA methyltransferase